MTKDNQKHLWDAIVIGSGIGGLVTATQLASKGAHVLVLERYTIPGGSSGAFHRNGYTFDVGASMIFGFGESGHTNLLTRALSDVDQMCETIPDPVQLAYHLPKNLEVTVSFYNDNPISIELPNQINCKISSTDAALKGQTVSSSYKPATLDNGIKIQVPPFVEEGDEIILDTRTIEYVKKI